VAPRTAKTFALGWWSCSSLRNIGQPGAGAET
jgi:hypothetical protein